MCDMNVRSQPYLQVAHPQKTRTLRHTGSQLPPWVKSDDFEVKRVQLYGRFLRSSLTRLAEPDSKGSTPTQALTRPRGHSAQRGLQRDIQSAFVQYYRPSETNLNMEDATLRSLHCCFWLLRAVTVIWLLGRASAIRAQNPAGFESIFDGKTLAGWHISAKSGHSKASGNKTGGRWVVEKGAIVGSQDIPGNGGIVITDKPFGNFEVVLEMNNDFGPDSGLFMRSTQEGVAYQAMIDYHAKGNLMGVYGEGMRGKPHARNFDFGDTVTEIRATNEGVPTLLPVRPESWRYFWRHGQWNELRARIVGNPPTITTWINGVKFMELTDTERRLPDTGGIALQVHGGGDFTKQYVRYRNIRVKRLD